MKNVSRRSCSVIRVVTTKIFSYLEKVSPEDRVECFLKIGAIDPRFPCRH